ncbi:hypothetical protein SAMN02745248_02110 [Hathewaya proteolytica DSM 3090]|uniref:Uncharacterized protein n=1 Tax=Hathewaya proteolytica DSM 3090 TaxID=1121331 RepID=A0A1M6QSV4_9CLOT|nr:hypothetical protein [Hathewaya proteolytica]SHK23294.1 hypothetical protein SAMN02745248_02110 [Hathewaya proteolytica DSM 3090]
MGFYRDVAKNEAKGLKQYKRRFEKMRISDFMAVSEKKYREVIFNKKYLEKITGTITGSIFVDEQNELVTNREVLKKLSKISYMTEILLDSEGSLSLSRLLKDDGDLGRDKKDGVGMVEALRIILENNVITKNMYMELKQVFEEFYASKGEDNEFIKKLLDNVEKAVKQNNNVVTEEILDKFKSDYKNVLLSNFIRIQKLYRHEKTLNEALTVCKKYERKIKVRWLSGRRINFGKLTYNLYYMVKVVNTYKPVLNLSSNQYDKKLDEIIKSNIENRYDGIRTL